MVSPELEIVTVDPLSRWERARGPNGCVRKELTSMGVRDGAGESGCAGFFHPLL
jgi:hypothetical protein